ncbi:J domain-containing protein [Pseudohoeflea coraliihabitans]|uniref:DnaJ family molecular chaperone n=1 Tax=Pseudohoeflea coraliihabitans TaxID=2860393 RepID=A0ABS6WJ09_9HYPH|nr:DnaJ family molecular chaperone [Pseudohoeflea sp. DP4N28-3]MBW3095933.1 DnaJ family molecular chaperone [Pseudohoeflea sp. DP4N28-3]
MSLFKRLIDAIGGTASQAFANVMESVRTVFAGDPEMRRKVAFSVAMIALSAKMAKADGIVSQEEVTAFQEIFAIPDEEAANVARLYNLAKQDVAGFDVYAERIARLCGSGTANCAMLEDILDGLFHIAKADGVVHQKELDFIALVADIFGFDERNFDRILARHVHPDGIDPFAVLGVSPDLPFAEIRKKYRKLAAESHPDALQARGVPEEFLAIANDRMAALNAAYRAIEKQQEPA